RSVNGAIGAGLRHVVGNEALQEIPRLLTLDGDHAAAFIGKEEWLVWDKVIHACKLAERKLIWQSGETLRDSLPQALAAGMRSPRQSDKGETAMPHSVDLVLRSGAIVTPGGLVEADLAISEGRIAAIGPIGQIAAAEEIEIRGLTVLPGVIDTQVHFREPGLTHKEDLASGTLAAIKGGVTTIFEMPNPPPPTTTAEALADKLRRAEGRAWCDHAFFVGATEENADELRYLEQLPGCAGVKMFMG